MAITNINRADGSKDYKVDSRSTIKQPHKPISVDICGDPNQKRVVSGVRVNDTTWPSGS